MNRSICTLLVNFGGPRTLEEVEPFLISLLTDQDVVRTSMPRWLHRALFKKIARKRAKKVSHDYAKIGGGSPIFADTEAIAAKLEQRSQSQVLTFHRYLPSTHPEFLRKIQAVESDVINVFPFFPQFTYATTGSIARFFCEHLPKELVHKMRWVKSYPQQKSFVRISQEAIRRFLIEHQLLEEETVLLFSAHGVPKKFIETGDLYQSECNASFNKIREAFPKMVSYLTYQSKFGKGEWLRPYTQEVCENILEWNQGRKHVAFYPISFTSDHIETLFEVEDLYMPLIAQKGLYPHRIDALNQKEEWVEAIEEIISESEKVHNCMLVRCGGRRCCESV